MLSQIILSASIRANKNGIADILNCFNKKPNAVNPDNNIKYFIKPTWANCKSTPTIATNSSATNQRM